LGAGCSAGSAQVGISAPQGCGKTTLVGQLTELLNAEGHASASVSIDDFYVRGEQQEALAAAAPDNELLRFRGNAGTHDLALASGTLGAWACAERATGPYLSAAAPCTAPPHPADATATACAPRPPLPRADTLRNLTCVPDAALLRLRLAREALSSPALGGTMRTRRRRGPRDAHAPLAARACAVLARRRVLTRPWRARRAAGATAAVPLYDKSLRGGRGDRAPQSAWPVVTGPLQVVCLEGWCLGFRPLASDAAAAAVHPGLAAVNAALRTYEAAMESRVDAWVVVRVQEPNWVFDWRLQAEVEMRKSGKPTLTDAQVADFVARFMPAYKAYLPVRDASDKHARAWVLHTMRG
jgi:pantothenate kinase-related protein Tda10